ncbi:uncharacterized protein KGF55_003105 [Candida pseudojiufengensis]|uniref:uncharacterized protein n=1 Tax=Candida pseudojiufengensis TaxID=497109 RepID=UPI0022248477|nr:uncharacterized protein KGF55_003105 [Candida pseudojiufengensis]KAI5963313.1 hypothetical protein KGF55_003105 [Candida pseudojiufengensis]
MDDVDDITTNTSTDINNNLNEFEGRGSKSRLRKFDKLIINQSKLIDEDDQIEYINELNKLNKEQYQRYKIYIIGFYLIQVLVIIIVRFKFQNGNIIENKLFLILFLISIILNLIQVVSKSVISNLNSNYKILIKVVKILINLQIIWTILKSLKTNNYEIFQLKFIILILICLNYSLPYFHESSFNSINQSVYELNELKYKFKNI